MKLQTEPLHRTTNDVADDERLIKPCAHSCCGAGDSRPLESGDGRWNPLRSRGAGGWKRDSVDGLNAEGDCALYNFFFFLHFFWLHGRMYGRCHFIHIIRYVLVWKVVGVLLGFLPYDLKSLPRK